MVTSNERRVDHRKGVAMMHRGIVLRVCILVLLGLTLFSSDLQAQPVREKILGDVAVMEEEDYAVVQVGFNFPIRYTRHFPADSGDELRIRLEPIAISRDDREALFKREGIHPPLGDVTSILEILYEGDIIGGFYLTVRFDRPTEFLVGQGADFRSLIIVVPTGDRSTTGSSSENMESPKSDH
jgi:hypothetical protein